MENDSAFVLLELEFQLRVFQVTDVHQCSKMDFMFVSLCCKNTLLLASDFVQLPNWTRLELLPFLTHCKFCIWVFFACGKRTNLCTDLYWALKCILWVETVPLVVLCIREIPLYNHILFSGPIGMHRGFAPVPWSEYQPNDSLFCKAWLVPCVLSNFFLFLRRFAPARCASFTSP